MRDLFVERIEKEANAALERGERLRACLPALAANLYARGAKRVTVFGSLITPESRLHSGSDIDMCVEGLDYKSVVDAAWELRDMAGAEVDLIRWEDASERVRGWVRETGKEMPNGTR